MAAQLPSPFGALVKCTERWADYGNGMKVYRFVDPADSVYGLWSQYAVPYDDSGIFSIGKVPTRVTCMSGISPAVCERYDSKATKRKTLRCDVAAAHLWATAAPRPGARGAVPWHAVAPTTAFLEEERDFGEGLKTYRYFSSNDPKYGLFSHWRFPLDSVIDGIYDSGDYVNPTEMSSIRGKPGYLSISVTVAGETKWMDHHRLIAMLYGASNNSTHPMIDPDCFVVDHINPFRYTSKRNLCSNHISNLQFLTHAQNCSKGDGAMPHAKLMLPYVYLPQGSGSWVLHREFTSNFGQGDKQYRSFFSADILYGEWSHIAFPMDGSPAFNTVTRLACTGDTNGYPTAASGSACSDLRTHRGVALLWGAATHGDLLDVNIALLVVDHLDNDRTNFAVSNLQWTTLGRNASKSNKATGKRAS